MYSLPLAALLIPYAIVLVIFGTVTLINIYHLTRYGATTSASFAVTFGFLAAATLVLFFTWQLTLGTDWSAPIALDVPVPQLNNSLFPLP